MIELTLENIVMGIIYIVGIPICIRLYLGYVSSIWKSVHFFKQVGGRDIANIFNSPSDMADFLKAVQKKKKKIEEEGDDPSYGGMYE